jgi:diguanylate cyclase (GGDEF)-like protein
MRADSIEDASQSLTDGGVSAILLDLSGGGEVSFAALDQTRAIAPEVPIVVLADQVAEDAALQAIRAGAQDVLAKGEITAAALKRALRYAIERKRAEVQLANRALHDPLTGLPNRTLFLDRLEGALDRSLRTGAAIAVLFVDVDHFKEINDTLGHAAGDRLLTVLAERLRSMLRPMDTVARFGGDEFTLLFGDLASENEITRIAERIGHAASAPITLDGAEAQVTVSIGVSTVTNPTVSPEELIREADAAMYRAKELGRGRFELFEPAPRPHLERRGELLSELESALERSELRVHYQPRYELGQPDGLAGFEALVRWQHPERGLIGPGEFIPLAEESEMVVRIGEYVMHQALRKIALWRGALPGLTVSVNMSLRQLAHPGLIAELESSVRAVGIDPAALLVEITEKTVFQDPDLAIRAARALKAVGVGVAIDDYGTGSSSLANLGRVPADVLKIHESFVTTLDDQPHDGAMVGAVVELGHALGMRVVAEGVETDAQLLELRSLGCDSAQGYLFCRPVSEEQVGELLTPAA